MQNVCESCGIAFHWQPTIVGKSIYCCLGCAEGGPCTCDYSLLPGQEDHAAIVVREQLPEGQAERREPSQRSN